MDGCSRRCGFSVLGLEHRHVSDCFKLLLFLFYILMLDLMD